MAPTADTPPPVAIDSDTSTVGETSPLLDDTSDALKKQPVQSLFANLYKGTGILAQIGGLLLAALVWAAVFQHPPLLPLFSPHPLLQAVGVLVTIQAILVLQPTEAGADKVRGARIHAALQLLSFLILGAGVGLIEANKIRSHGAHFHSVHGYLGVITSIVLLGQYVFGLLIWAAPSGVFASVDRAKALWKHHRWVGYVAVVPLLLATVITATATDYNVNVLNIKLWAVLVASALVAVGVYPRIHKRKLGFQT